MKAMVCRTRVKICGMTDGEAIDAAIAEGVDAIGFIFVEKSPRKIDPERTKEIVAAFPPFVEAIGVFMDAELDIAQDIIHYCGLTAVQLHGSEPPHYCEKMPCPVIKTIHVKPDMQTTDMESFYGTYRGAVKGFLLDTYEQGSSGGTGKPFDWTVIQRIRPPKPFILAGGLSSANIPQAIQTVRPFAVDVNSGVEKTKGVKDIKAIRSFMKAVRQTDEQLAGSLSAPSFAL